MVSTRHHPRPFPEPTLPPSRSPTKDTNTSTSSSPTKTSTPPSPTVESTPAKRTPARRSTRKSTADVASTDNSNSSSLVRTRSRRRARSQTQTQNYVHHPNSLTIVWLIGSLVLVVWDTLYVLGRPHTMPGGRYHSPIWTPYALYGTIDYIYGWPAWNENNGFTAAQASLNVVETAMYLYYLYVVFSGVTEGWKVGVFDKLWREKTNGKLTVVGPNVATAVVVLWASSVMTVSKTVLYGLNEAFSNFKNVGHNDGASLFFLWIIPNGSWIVFPTYMVYILSKEIVAAMHVAGESGEKED